jgi:uncharacterized membrane protein
MAGAQFTTFIPPQNKVADSVKAAVVAEQKAQADSVAAMQITNMKTWVDSAAGIAPTPTTAADSLATAIAANDSTTTSASQFPNGTRAPETASALPLLVLLGTVALALGGVLLVRGREDRTAKARARRDRA